MKWYKTTELSHIAHHYYYWQYYTPVKWEMKNKVHSAYTKREITNETKYIELLFDFIQNTVFMNTSQTYCAITHQYQLSIFHWNFGEASFQIIFILASHYILPRVKNYIKFAKYTGTCK